MDSTIYAAVITSVVTILGFIVTYFSLSRQYKNSINSNLINTRRTIYVVCVKKIQIVMKEFSYINGKLLEINEERDNKKSQVIDEGEIESLKQAIKSLSEINSQLILVGSWETAAAFRNFYFSLIDYEKSLVNQNGIHEKITAISQDVMILIDYMRKDIGNVMIGTSIRDWDNMSI